MSFSGRWNYPGELPVVERREEIIAAIRENQVVVVVSDTGSGKTTQLPKMVAEALGEDTRYQRPEAREEGEREAGEERGDKDTSVLALDSGFSSLRRRRLIGCTQPRRVAALSISRRVADELNVEWGREVGCKIRFDDRTTGKTVIKFLTDGQRLTAAMAELGDALDLPRMRRLLDSLDDGITSEKRDQCSMVLARGVMAGEFLRRFD